MTRLPNVWETKIFLKLLERMVNLLEANLRLQDGIQIEDDYKGWDREDD